MTAYIYQAELLCEPCATNVRVHLDSLGKKPANPDDETTYDSDDYPKGPYPDGGGEADSEQHCGYCQIALENPVIEPRKENQ
jgi:hypothetical protein